MQDFSPHMHMHACTYMCYNAIILCLTMIGPGFHWVLSWYIRISYDNINSQLQKCCTT